MLFIKIIKTLVSTYNPTLDKILKRLSIASNFLMRLKMFQSVFRFISYLFFPLIRNISSAINDIFIWRFAEK